VIILVTPEDIILSAIFQNNQKLLYSIKFDSKPVKKARKKLIDTILHCIPYRNKIKKIRYKLSFEKYVEIYVENIFNSTLTLLESQKRQGHILFSPILYHGTTTGSLDKIMKEGLLPSKAGKIWFEDRYKRSYMTDSMYAADFFALTAAKSSEQPVILEINIEDLIDTIKSLDFERLNHKYLSIFDIYKQFYLDQKLPPENIVNYYIFERGQSIFYVLRKINEFYAKKQSSIDVIL